jgi:sugar lactone lactonase YvrE
VTDRKRTTGAAAAMAVVAMILTACTATTPDTQPAPTVTPRMLTGSVAPLAAGIDPSEWTVTAWNTSRDGARDIGTATSDDSGAFTLSIDETDVEGIVWVDAHRADDDQALLGAIAAPGAATVTLNERTTVAAGYGLAQFFGESVPTGPVDWVENAASMAANLADPATGAYGEVLTSSPNGSETSTLAAFTSLSAMLSACLQNARACETLFGAAAHDRDRLVSAAAAFAGIARDPSAAVDALFQLSRTARAVDPGLSDPPAAWTIALRFDGDGTDLSGPGNFAIDPEGHIWINNNYQYDADPSVPVCGSDQAYEFGPDGRLLSTLKGGGLSGSGFGIEFDRKGRLWFSNFGFAAASPGCPDEDQPPHNTMSLFKGQTPLSPDAGFTQGDLSWPQGIELDREENLWIANCGNDTIAMYPKGDPKKAKSFTDLGLTAPFAIVDNGTHLFATGTVNNAVAVFGRDGTAVADSPLTGFDRPMGIASDQDGNVWVANSGGISLPCPERVAEGRGTPSVTMISPDSATVSTPYTGGGVTLPWGIATDGDGNVWVANFSGQRVSEFCGADASSCPRDLTTGEAISPDDTGYAFDGLTRSTGIAIDLSGNVWVTNNWLTVAEQTNPGGHQIVAFVGAAAPVYVAPFD